MKESNISRHYKLLKPWWESVHAVHEVIWQLTMSVRIRSWVILPFCWFCSLNIFKISLNLSILIAHKFFFLRNVPLPGLSVQHFQMSASLRFILGCLLKSAECQCPPSEILIHWVWGQGLDIHVIPRFLHDSEGGGSRIISWKILPWITLSKVAFSLTNFS